MGLSKKIGIGVLIIAVMALVYYVSHRELKESNSISTEKPSSNDSSRVGNRDATMGPKPEISPKDGSVKIVKEFVKKHSKNPSTLEFFEWSEVSSQGNYWMVRCKYRGISSFNAEVTTNAWFYIQHNKVVHTKIVSKI